MINFPLRSSAAFQTVAVNSAAFRPMPRVNTIGELYSHLLATGIIDLNGTPQVALAPPELTLESLHNLTNLLNKPLGIHSNPKKRFLSPNTYIGKATAEFLISPFRSAPCYLIGSSVIPTLGISYIELIFRQLKIELSPQIKEEITSLFVVNDHDVQVNCINNRNLLIQSRNIITRKIHDVSVLPLSDFQIKQAAFLKAKNITDSHSVASVGRSDGDRLELSFFSEVLDRPYLYKRDDVRISLQTNTVITSTGDILETVFHYLFKLVDTPLNLPFNNLMLSRMLSLNFQNHYNVNPDLPEILLDFVLSKKPSSESYATYLVSLLTHAVTNHLPYEPNGVAQLALQLSYPLCSKIDQSEFTYFWNVAKNQNRSLFVSDEYLNVFNGFCAGTLNPVAFFHYLYLHEVPWAQRIVQDFTFEDLLEYCKNPSELTQSSLVFPLNDIDVLELLVRNILKSPAWYTLWKELSQNYSSDKLACYQQYLPYIPISIDSLFNTVPPQSKVEEPPVYEENPVTKLSYPWELSKLKETVVVKKLSLFNMTGEEEAFQERFDAHTKTCTTQSQIIEILNFGKSKREHLSSHDALADVFMKGITHFRGIPVMDYGLDFSKISDPVKRLELLHHLNCYNFPYEKFDLSPTLAELPFTVENDNKLQTQIPFLDAIQINQEALTLWLTKVVKSKIGLQAVYWVNQLIHKPSLSFMKGAPSMRDFVYFYANQVDASMCDVETMKEMFCLTSQQDDVHFFAVHLAQRSELNIVVGYALRLNHLKFWKQICQRRPVSFVYKLDLPSFPNATKMDLLKLVLSEVVDPMDKSDHLNSVIKLKESIEFKENDKEVLLTYINWLIASHKDDCFFEAIKNIVSLPGGIKNKKILTELTLTLVAHGANKQLSYQPHVNALFDLPLFFKDKLLLALFFDFPERIVAYKTTFDSHTIKEKAEIAFHIIVPDRSVINFTQELVVSSPSLHLEIGDEASSKLYTKWILCALKVFTTGPLSQEILERLTHCASVGIPLLDLTDPATESSYFDFSLLIITKILERKWEIHLINTMIETLFTGIVYNSERLVKHQGEGWAPFLPHTMVGPLTKALIIEQPLTKNAFTIKRKGRFKLKFILHVLRNSASFRERPANYIYLVRKTSSFLRKLIPDRKLWPVDFPEAARAFVKFREFAPNQNALYCFQSEYVNMLGEIAVKKHENKDLAKLFRHADFFSSDLNDVFTYGMKLEKEITSLVKAKTVESCRKFCSIYSENNEFFLQSGKFFANSWTRFLKSYAPLLGEKTKEGGHTILAVTLEILRSTCFKKYPNYLHDPEIAETLREFFKVAVDMELCDHDVVLLADFLQKCIKEDVYTPAEAESLFHEKFMQKLLSQPSFAGIIPPEILALCKKDDKDSSGTELLQAIKKL